MEQVPAMGLQIETFAREWRQSQNHSNSGGKQLGLVTESVQQLATQVDLCRDQIAAIWSGSDAAPDNDELEQNGIFFNPNSILPDLPNFARDCAAVNRTLKYGSLNISPNTVADSLLSNRPNAMATLIRTTS